MIGAGNSGFQAVDTIFGAIGAVGMVVIGVVLLVVAILGFFLPLIVNGIYNKAAKIVKELEKTNALLEDIRDSGAGFPLKEKEECIGGIKIDESLYGEKKENRK